MPVFTPVPAASLDEQLALKHQNFNGSYIITHADPVTNTRYVFAELKSVRKALKLVRKTNIIDQFRVILMNDPAQFWYVTSS